MQKSAKKKAAKKKVAKKKVVKKKVTSKSLGIALKEPAKKLLAWMREQRAGHAVTIRDICRSGPRCARKSATVARRLVGLLVDHGYLIRLADNSCMLSFEAMAGDTGDNGDIPHG